MDTFYAFLIFVVILALEMLARQSWLSAYYRFGIPVFLARRDITGGAAPDGLIKSLQDRFKNRPGHPTLRFKLLTSAEQNQAVLGFHEALFDPQGGPRYFPVLHSLAQVDTARGEVRVIGWLNWYVVFLLFYLIYNTIADRGFLFVALLVAFLFGLSYVAQAGVNHVVLEEIQAEHNRT